MVVTQRLGVRVESTCCNIDYYVHTCRLPFNLHFSHNSGSRHFGGGGARNMTYKPPRSVAIFFMTIFTCFYRSGGPILERDLEHWT